jgi:hypothetical protein
MIASEPLTFEKGLSSFLTQFRRCPNRQCSGLDGSSNEHRDRNHTQNERPSNTRHR